LFTVCCAVAQNAEIITAIANKVNFFMVIKINLFNVLV